MKFLMLLLSLLLVSAGCFWLAEKLSPDAIGMAVGLLFGVLGTIPVALLVMASNRNSSRGADNDDYMELEKYQYAPPVIILHSSNDYSTHNHLHIGKYEGEREELFDYDPFTATYERQIGTKG